MPTIINLSSSTTSKKVTETRSDLRLFKINLPSLITIAILEYTTIVGAQHTFATASCNPLVNYSTFSASLADIDREAVVYTNKMTIVSLL